MSTVRALQTGAALLLLASLPLPYAYYPILRVTATLAFVYVAYVGYDAKHWPAVAVSVFLAGLFNPLLPIHLNRDWWALFDVSASGYLLAIASHVESRFKCVGSITAKPNDVIAYLATAMFAGVFAATALAFLFFLLSYPMGWLGRPSLFISLRHLFLPVFAGAVVFHVVGIAYHEASTSSPKNAA